METRIFIIRLLVIVIMAVASFTAGWYLFLRFDQLEQDSISSVEVKEPNNPRLNYTKIDRITNNFESREDYERGQQVNIQIPEEDPFYSP